MFHTIAQAATTGIVKTVGIISEISDQNAQIYALVGGVSVTAVVVYFLFKLHKSGWAFGTLIGALVIGGAILWVTKGSGLETIGHLFSGQLG